MYIGKSQKFGRVEIDFGSMNVSSGGEGYNNKLEVFTKDEGQIGTLYMTKDENEDITYFEWCKGNYVQNAGIKIELQELIEFIESKEPQD